MINIEEIKKLVKSECDELGHVESWFYENHLLSVEKFAKDLLEKLPEANEEIVMLGVWLHDLQRVRGIQGDHAEEGAKEAEKVMREFGYSKDIMTNVKKIILSHSCNKIFPETLEGKILASADAMAHYIKDFYLIIAVTGQRNVEEYKKWALEKLNRDYNKKIYFDFAKQEIRARHDILMKFFTMD